MKLTYTTFRLQCTHPFGIARSSHNYYDRVFIYLEQDGIIGRGEAAPTERYNESIPQIVERLRKGILVPENVTDISELINIINEQFDGIVSLRSTLVSAALDWWTQKQGQPLYEYCGYGSINTKPTSFTIAIGDFNELEQKVREAESYRILKVKLGTNNDKKIITEIRKYTDKPIRIDANEGWNLDTAIRMTEWLAENNIELIEQPLPAAKFAKMPKLKAHSPIPLIADENCHTSDDIEKLVEGFDGINIKLTKCGGLDEVENMLKIANRFDMKIMYGCMIESSVAITALAHLASEADYLDLDGNLLVDNDPYIGVKIVDGKLVLPNGNGLGILLKDEFQKQYPDLK